MSEWIYTQYFYITSQYLSYFSSLLILLASASALSIIKTGDETSERIATPKTSSILFYISIAFSCTSIIILLHIYNNLKIEILSMLQKCTVNGGEFSCDMAMPTTESQTLTVSMWLALASLIALVFGHAWKIWSTKNAKK